MSDALAKRGRDGRDGKPGPVGPRGRDGPPGPGGAPGRSAYDLARTHGHFAGDVAAWLASLQGERGIEGPQGPEGPRGPVGPIGPMPRHQWQGTELRFELRDGAWGEFVDLQGPQGPPGSATESRGGGPLRLPFTALSDVPHAYAGFGAKVVSVKADESGLEFTTPTGGSGTPGGADTQVQFNDGGAFGGNAALTFNKATGTLSQRGPMFVGVPTYTGVDVTDVTGGDLVSVDSVGFQNFSKCVPGTDNASLYGAYVYNLTPASTTRPIANIFPFQVTQVYRATGAITGYTTAMVVDMHFDSCGNVAEADGWDLGFIAENCNIDLVYGTFCGINAVSGGTIGTAYQYYASATNAATKYSFFAASGAGIASFADGVNVDSLSASQVVVTDGSKNLVSGGVLGDGAFVGDMVGDAGTGGTHGLVPAPAAGDATKVLSGAGTWITASSPSDAAADGVTKGIATFTAGDFDATAGVISLDYTNGQAADATHKGFLTAADWSTFNSKGSGTVTSIATTSPISGGTITGTGTISLLTNVDFAFTLGQSVTEAIAATSTDGLSLINGDTAAAAGAQKWSPRLRFTGKGWKTDATAGSQVVDWIAELQPVQGTAAPSANLVFSSQVNAGGYTARATLTSAGALVMSTLNAPGTLTPVVGVGSASAGFYSPSVSEVSVTLNGSYGATFIRSGSDTYFTMPSAGHIDWRDSANYNGNRDTGLYRNTAGLLEVNSGTAGTYRDLIARELYTAPTSANGQKLGITQLTELLTIAAAATSTTVIQIPAGAIVLAVSVRVTTAVTCTSVFEVGDGTTANKFNTASVSKAATTTDKGTKAGPVYYAAATSIVITPDTTPTDATGRCRITIHYIEAIPPTS